MSITAAGGRCSASMWEPKILERSAQESLVRTASCSSLTAPHQDPAHSSRVQSKSLWRSPCPSSRNPRTPACGVPDLLFHSGSQSQEPWELLRFSCWVRQAFVLALACCERFNQDCERERGREFGWPVFLFPSHLPSAEGDCLNKHWQYLLKCSVLFSVSTIPSPFSAHTHIQRPPLFSSLLDSFLSSILACTNTSSLVAMTLGTHSRGNHLYY